MTDLLRAALPGRLDPELAQAARRPFIADHVVQALAAGRVQPRAAGAAMAAWFRRTRRLGSKDRRRVQELAYGVVRHQGLLDRAGAGSDAERVALLAQVLEGERFPGLAAGTPAEDLATALSLPEEVAAEWLELLGPLEAAAFAAVQATQAPLYLRVHAGRSGPDAAATGLPVPTRLHPPWGIELLERCDLHTTPAWQQGLVEVQDLSSQRFVQAIAAQAELAGSRVLDLCAGAGGKTLALAALGARVHATDLRAEALAELAKRAARAGDAVVLGPPEADYDLVVVDAPCSGTGRLRREPTLRWGLEPDRHVQAQRQLVADGAARVRPGGLLAYATCSLLRRENDVEEPEGWTLLEARVCWPHRQAGDGFGWRLWRRPAA